MALRRQKPVVERTRDGYVIRLRADELELLGRLLGELRGLVLSTDAATDAIRRRLFPPAYHLADDAEAEAEYQRLMREELVASRLDALQRVETAFTQEQPTVLDEAGVQGLLQSLNALRLVLGTILDIGEEDDLDNIPDDHPMFGEHHLYAFLSWLLEVTVQAVMSPSP